MQRFLFLAVVAAAGAVGAASDEGEGLVQEKPKKGWHLRIGPVLSPRVRVSVSGPQVTLPTRPPSDWKSSGTGAEPPPQSGFVDRKYADGYVNLDEGTTDDKTADPGLTWDWGVDNFSGQYSSGKMTFHTEMTRWTESYTSTSTHSGSDSDGNRDLLVGVEALGGWTFFENKTFDAAVDAGFRFYGSGTLDAESRYGTTVTTTRNEYRDVDTFNAQGWTDPLPTGTYAGKPTGPDRLLGAEPESRQKDELMPNDPTKSKTYDYYHHGDTRLIYRIWDLRLGPTVGWQATDWLAIRSGVYGLLGLVDARLKTHADTSSGPQGASASTCGAVFGMAFALSAQVNITDDLFLYGGAEYDWWTNSVDLNAGGASAEIKLSDLVVSLGLGMEF